MKQINLLLLCAFMCMGLVSCSVPNDPVKISEAMVKSFNKGDFEGAKKYWADENGENSWLDELQDMYDNPEKYENKRNSEQAKDLVDAEYTFTDSNIEEDRAQVKYRYVTPGIKNSMTFYFEKKDGKWKLMFIK